MLHIAIVLLSLFELSLGGIWKTLFVFTDDDKQSMAFVSRDSANIIAEHISYSLPHEDEGAPSETRDYQITFVLHLHPG